VVPEEYLATLSCTPDVTFLTSPSPSVPSVPNGRNEGDGAWGSVTVGFKKANSPRLTLRQRTNGSSMDEVFKLALHKALSNHLRESELLQRRVG